jgi:hypothetical protein
VTAWHLDADLPHRYASGEVDFVLAASVESHILRCAQCRQALAVALPADRLDRIWDAVASRIDAPRTRLVRQLLTRRKMPRSRPSWRPSWSSCRVPRVTGVSAVLGPALAALPTRLLTLATAAAHRRRKVLTAPAQRVARLPRVVGVSVQTAGNPTVARTGILAVLIVISSVVVVSTSLSPPESPLADPPPTSAQPRWLPQPGPPALDPEPAPSQARTSAPSPSTPAASRSSGRSAVKIDATATSYSVLSVVGVTNWLNAKTVQHLGLSPGWYAIETVATTAVPFRITDSGAVDYDRALDGSLSGRGSSTLVIRGYPIEVDATSPSYSAFTAASLGKWLDARTAQPLRTGAG